VANKDIVKPIPGESQASYMTRWRTKQTQLADYAKQMAKAPQRTLEDFLPKE